MSWQPDRSWYSRDAREVAPELLGAHIHTAMDDIAVTIRITEVEAYCGTMDPGSHAFGGATNGPPWWSVPSATYTSTSPVAFLGTFTSDWGPWGKHSPWNARPEGRYPVRGRAAGPPR